ncbi:MAG: mechanosensitive ion channel [Microcoleaceae cyanobacterium MO_207.B10]|nr:mechanosensitive ion channel [Microcoleaceae cyanobacterium MO_207.B10]
MLNLPAGAQSVNNNNIETAPIQVNGQTLFRVSNLDNLTATERANVINSRLEKILQSAESINVEIVDNNQETTLKVNGNDLLTITDADFLPGITKEKQKTLWRDKVEKALISALKESQPDYIIQALIIIGMTIALAITMEFLLRWCGVKINHDWQEKFPRKIEYLQKFYPLIAILCRIGISILIAFILTDLAASTRQIRNEFVSIFTASFTSNIFELGNKGFSILDLLLLIGLTVGLWTSVRSFIIIFRTRIVGLTGAERSVQDTISFLTQYGLIFLGILIILQLWGVDISSLAIIASALGVGIGFGLQNVANNFVSGIIIVFERPIQVGDFIQVADLVGVVERIGLRSTHITTLDQVSLIVPNSRFLENEVLNWSHGNPISRIRVPIGVAYGSNIQLVRKAILEVAKTHPEVLLHPSPQLWFQEFADSSLNFELFVWTREPQKQYKLRSELNYRMEANLRKYNISIPFPQRDLHLKSPEIEDMIHTWMRQNSPPPVELYYPDNVRAKCAQKISNISLDEDDYSKVNITDSFNDKINKKIDLDSLIEEMRSINGVSIRDRRHRWDLYSKCFIGSEAVEWLMHTQKVTLNEAVSIGQLLIDRGLIHHVHDKHGFKNEYIFYRFYADEQ